MGRLKNDSNSKTTKLEADSSRTGEWSMYLLHDAKNKKYRIEFNPKYKRRVDPFKNNKLLNSRPAFKTKKEAKEYAEQIVEQYTSQGNSTSFISPDDKNYLLLLCKQLKDLDVDPKMLLNTSLTLKQNNFDPLNALEQGSEIIKKCTDYTETTLKYWIDLYSKDKKEISRKKKHKNYVWSLQNTFRNAHNVSFKHLFTEESAISMFQPCVKAYTEREGVSKRSSLKAQITALRGLLRYIKKTTKQVPTESVISAVGKIDSYVFDKELEGAKPKYGFRPREVLLAIKFFSQDKYWNPAFPIISTLTGCRQDMYDRLLWEYFHQKTVDGDEYVCIPNGETKKGLLGMSTDDITYAIEYIPNLKVWLEWLSLQYEQKGIKQEGSIQRVCTKTKYNHNNILVREYRDLFDFPKKEETEAYLNYIAPKDRKKDLSEVGYNRIRPISNQTFGANCENGWRKAFVSLGEAHPIVKQNLSQIAQDEKSLDRYRDNSYVNKNRDARVLFEMTPQFLNLVDLENKTVDTEFLNGTKEDRIRMFNSTDGKQREIYKRICLSLGYSQHDLTHVDDLFNDPPEYPDIY